MHERVVQDGSMNPPLICDPVFSWCLHFRRDINVSSDHLLLSRDIYDMPLGNNML